MAENCRRFQAASGAGAAAPCTSWRAGLFVVFVFV